MRAFLDNDSGSAEFCLVVAFLAALVSAVFCFVGKAWAGFFLAAAVVFVAVAGLFVV